jgi:hypothetical protein
MAIYQCPMRRYPTVFILNANISTDEGYSQHMTERDRQTSQLFLTKIKNKKIPVWDWLHSLKERFFNDPPYKVRISWSGQHEQCSHWNCRLDAPGGRGFGV